MSYDAYIEELEDEIETLEQKLGERFLIGLSLGVIIMIVIYLLIFNIFIGGNF
ncbi:MAG: hypothetical protein HWN66_16180 [Candidatus Helarchaeota archaeon]|nr:hypothetical protein [Candidatus Helarchaeota archaeon]